jgi:hypothetical protein
VALYGAKAEPVRGMFARVQALIAEHIGASFLPYSMEQIHATLIAFNGVRDPASGAIVNEYFLEHTGTSRTMDIDLAMRILTERFAQPLPVRVGGYRPGDEVPFRSRGQHLYQRTFSWQGDAFVLVGWPASPGSASDRVPLDRLRRDLNAAGLLHRYHARGDDIDGDMHLVVGHRRGARDGGAQDGAVDEAVAAVRDELAAHPVEFAIAIGDVKVVVASNHTLAPPLYVSPIPADASTVLALTGALPRTRAAPHQGRSETAPRSAPGHQLARSNGYKRRIRMTVR